MASLIYNWHFSANPFFVCSPFSEFHDFSQSPGIYEDFVKNHFLIKQNLIRAISEFHTVFGQESPVLTTQQTTEKFMFK